MPKLAAVTGATGFIGRHVVIALRRQGWEVRALVRRHPAELLSPHHRLEVVLGDLADTTALERLVDAGEGKTIMAKYGLTSPAYLTGKM